MSRDVPEVRAGEVALDHAHAAQVGAVEDGPPEPRGSQVGVAEHGPRGGQAHLPICVLANLAPMKAPRPGEGARGRGWRP